MSQLPPLLTSPPPPPPIPLPVKKSDQDESKSKWKKDNEFFVSSFDHAPTDKEAIVNEIISLCKQEYLLNERSTSSTEDVPGIVDGVKMLTISSILEPILQNGPICGLAALAMIAHHSSVDVVPSSRIFQEALDKGFTKRGEMFSADNMASLSHQILPGYKVEQVKTKEMNDEEIKDMISGECLRGNYFLVPYDADRNHRPGLFKGQKAHWCVITGFSVAIKSQDLHSTLKMSFWSDEKDVVLFLEPNTLSEDQKHDLAAAVNNIGPDTNISVLTRQSKSKHVGLWPLHDLIESNRNLFEISSAILEDSNNYVLHSIQETLRDQLVVIKSK